LHLLQVVQPFANSDNEQGALLGNADRLQEQALRDAQDYLQAVADRVCTVELGARELQLTWSAVIAEDVATTLIQLAEGVTAPLIQLAQDGEEAEDTRKEMALIALATHGRGGLQRWTAGSVAECVLEATRIPLLLVRPSREAD
jgi:nucleotide-binding universal stress UspA family protein